MAYSQFGYAFPSGTVSSSPALVTRTSQTSSSSPRPSTSCCETGRPIMTDPHTGQTICSCQYTAVLSAARSTALAAGPGVGTGAEAVYNAALASQSYMAGLADPTLLYNPLTTVAQTGKDGHPYGPAAAAAAAAAAATLSPFQATGLYYPYDPALLSSYSPYGYGMDYNGMAPRKNATKETTSTLKAWLNEHKKNPYPTKGEKIMLAIITKMTLTQVSTWFANARRRLKKENKMTWSPRNKTDDDDDSDIDADDVRSTGNRSSPDPEADLEVNVADDGDSRDVTHESSSSSKPNCGTATSASTSHRTDCNIPASTSHRTDCNILRDNSQLNVNDLQANQNERDTTTQGGINKNPPEMENKPKIWSLADTATMGPAKTNMAKSSTSANGKLPSPTPGQNVVSPQTLSPWYKFGVHPALSQQYAMAPSANGLIRTELKSQGRFMPYPQVHPAFTAVHPAFHRSHLSSSASMTSSLPSSVTSTITSSTKHVTTSQNNIINNKERSLSSSLSSASGLQERPSHLTLPKSPKTGENVK